MAMTEIIQSENIAELAKALSAAQGELESANKDAKNPFFKSSYATLAECVEVSRPVLTKNALSIVQTTIYNEQIGTTLVTTLLHSSGQWMRGFYPLNAMKKDPQAMGSAMTYARRYAYSAIIGLTQSDDDGESAMERTVRQTIIEPDMTPNEERPELGKAYCSTHGVIMAHGVSKAGKPYTFHKNEQGEICFGNDYMQKKVSA